MRASLAVAAVVAGLTLLLSPPADMESAAWRAAGLALGMAILWVAEPVPLVVTALFPLVLAPGLGLAALADVAGFYSNPLIFLFLGGFILARSIERWGLHRRIAFALLSLAGDRPAQVLAALMATTA
ncbi:SLC13 family permease, partial [Cereibacter sphaeroides]|uniref:SLC13 family permease n=1 Tax=Cereibacter sphaeroides TaxID=1063 RepID=UPI001F3E025E